MKKVQRILLIIPTLYLFVMPVYLAHTSYSRPCSGIEITIIDSADYYFITKGEILNIINRSSGRILGTLVRDIPVSEIEKRIIAMHELRIAEVYIAIDGTMHVYTDQRNPVMRVMAANGGDYYVDDDGFVVRRRNLYTPRLHIVGGNVNITSAMLNGFSVLDTSIKKTILSDIYYLIDYIKSDKFWSAQIDQIYVDSFDEIDMVPRVGNHTVHLGAIENFKGKLKNLEVFYKEVLPEVGWNKYSVINLEYKDQIVCKKR